MHYQDIFYRYDVEKVLLRPLGTAIIFGNYFKKEDKRCQ